MSNQEVRSEEHVNQKVSRYPQDTRDALLNDLVQIIEGRGERAFVASILVLEGKQLRHAAAPGLPARYRESVNGMAIGPDMVLAAPPPFAANRSTSPTFRPTLCGRAGREP